MNNPFGRLLASQASGEAILCSVFAFYVAPMMWTDSSTMIKYSYYAGWINLICYDICTWSHLFISINRFVAICTPMRYETVFGLVIGLSNGFHGEQSLTFLLVN